MIKDTNFHLGLWGLIIGIIGLFLSIYFYFKSEKESEVSYNISALRIFDSSSTSSLSVFDKSGERIGEDIQAFNILVWNSGSVDLGPEKIRKPMSFSIGDRGSILEASIVAQRNPDISRFYVKEVGQNDLEIGWSYFDPNDAFRLRIVCVKCEAAALSTSLKMLGLDGMREREAQATAKTNSNIALAIVFMFLGSLYGGYKLANYAADKFYNFMDDRGWVPKTGVKRRIILILTIAPFSGGIVWLLMWLAMTKMPPLLYLFVTGTPPEI